MFCGFQVFHVVRITQIAKGWSGTRIDHDKLTLKRPSRHKGHPQKARHGEPYASSERTRKRIGHSEASLWRGVTIRDTMNQEKMLTEATYARKIKLPQKTEMKSAIKATKIHRRIHNA